MPATASSGERLIALEIADQINDKTRIGTAIDLDDVARRTGYANAKQVGKVLGKLAARGLEMRIPIGKREDGSPVFAYEGRKTNYRVPTAEELGVEEVPRAGDHSPREVPPAGPSGPPLGAERSPARGRVVPPAGDPAPQASLKEHLNNPQQQRPRAKTRGAQPLPQHIKIITGATDATPDEAQAVAQLIADEKHPNNLPGFLRRLAEDRELDQWLTRVRATGDRAARTAFLAGIRGQPDCEHGHPGGHIRSPDGWVACPHERRRLTRAAPDAQAVFDEITRLAAAGREDEADQVLAGLPDDVLDQVDRLEAAARARRYPPPKPAGPRRTGGHQPYRNPVDQSVYDQPL
jgi:hypothetical protein